MPRKKVKDMPRKQQMAVKASMAEQAAGKKSPAKFIRTGGSSITKNKLGKKINKVMEKGTKKLIDAGVHAYKNPKSMATGFGGLKKKKSPAKKNKDYVDFNNPKVEKNYKENPEFRKYLKEKKGVTYDAKTRVSKTVKPMAKLEDAKKKTSPALAKLSASCKAAARKKFKVYPSAYANMWASKTQKAGKC